MLIAIRLFYYYRALLPKEPNDAAYHPKWPTFDPETISWKGHLKTLLLEKAVLVYATLAEYYISQVTVHVMFSRFLLHFYVYIFAFVTIFIIL